MKGDTMKRFGPRRGFSVIELILIVAILVVLGLMALQVSRSYSAELENSAAQLIPATEENIQLAAHSLFNDNITVMAYAMEWSYEGVDDLVDDAKAAAAKLASFGVPSECIVIMFANGPGLDEEIFPTLPKPDKDGIYLYLK